MEQEARCTEECGASDDVCLFLSCFASWCLCFCASLRRCVSISISITAHGHPSLTTHHTHLVLDPASTALSMLAGFIKPLLCIFTNYLNLFSLSFGASRKAIWNKSNVSPHFRPVCSIISKAWRWVNTVPAPCFIKCFELC